jgi:hypothetical protein
LPHLISSLTGGPAPGASAFGPLARFGLLAHFGLLARFGPLALFGLLARFQEAVPGVNTN